MEQEGHVAERPLQAGHGAECGTKGKKAPSHQSAFRFGWPKLNTACRESVKGLSEAALDGFSACRVTMSHQNGR